MVVSPIPPALLKYVVGIDIAKDTFVACFGSLDAAQQLRLAREKTFANTPDGFAALLAWVRPPCAQAVPLGFVAEATGVYYEQLAYFLADQAQVLAVLLPNKVKHFAQSTAQKSKTDPLDARLRCRLGLEHVLPAWQPPTPALRQLRALARERQALTQQAARLKAQRHAYEHRDRPDARTLERLASHLALLAQQRQAIDDNLAALLESAPELARKVAHLASIPGIGQTTAVVVAAETLGFALVENERQLASYAGLDVIEHQSGTSRGRTRISRRGNVRLRTALYLPAVSSTRCNPQQAAFYTRLRQRHPNGKPGVVAVMRKLLLLCYSLWKNDVSYDPRYHPAHPVEKKIAPATKRAGATQDEPREALLEEAQR